MNLEIFHHEDRSHAWNSIMDEKNSGVSSFHCESLEWTGWYDTSVAIRLLGHYRLFQLYKKRPANSTGLPPELDYIVHYSQNIYPGGKLFQTNFWARLIAFLKLSTPRDNPAVKSVNQILLFKRTDILHAFLVAAEVDFETALFATMKQIGDPAFFSEGPVTHFNIQFEEHQHNTVLAKNEFHVHPIIKEATQEKGQESSLTKEPRGKEKDVFSKKQILILFDLLAETGKVDPLNLRQPNKFPAIAHLMRAITGKGEDTWMDVLKDYRTKGLYEYNSEGERKELLNTLTNISDKLEKAGLRSLAHLAEKKIRQLRIQDN